MLGVTVRTEVANTQLVVSGMAELAAQVGKSHFQIMSELSLECGSATSRDWPSQGDHSLSRRRYTRREFLDQSLVLPCSFNQLFRPVRLECQSEIEVERFIVGGQGGARPRGITLQSNRDCLVSSRFGGRQPLLLGIGSAVFIEREERRMAGSSTVPFSGAAFCGAKNYNPCLRSVLLL